MTTSTSTFEEKEGISLLQAARDLGVSRRMMDYYRNVLELVPFKQPLDNNLYLSREDVDRIKTLREAAARRRRR